MAYAGASPNGSLGKPISRSTLFSEPPNMILHFQVDVENNLSICLGVSKKGDLQNDTFP